MKFITFFFKKNLIPIELTCTLDEVNVHLYVLADLMVAVFDLMLQWLHSVCGMAVNVSPSMVLLMNVMVLTYLVHSIAAAEIVLYK